ncbi:hypothetical protein BV898_16097 [Hypsibius exemplaris]|uniref:Uncharacterized protein n=1 Tax=Hypsibius exemplaris TaxID=2072580 RepID=A0A9X6NLC4_HYPEX|nr:hypothetical protein BV898_16097 [Hypsibius exemplaris]
MQTTTSLQPDSSAILGRRPLGTYARNSPWIHTANQHCEWAGGVGQPGDLKENLLSSFDISLARTVIITVTLGQTVKAEPFIITVTLGQTVKAGPSSSPSTLGQTVHHHRHFKPGDDVEQSNEAFMTVMLPRQVQDEPILDGRVRGCEDGGVECRR